MSHNIYIIGGPAKVGKSFIAEEIKKRPSTIWLETDKIRGAIKHAITTKSPKFAFKIDEIIYEMRMATEEKDVINYEVTSSYQQPGKQNHVIQFLVEIPKDNLLDNERARIFIHEFLRAFDMEPWEIDLVIEGVSFELPEDTQDLKLNNIALKKAFIWYGGESHVENVITHAVKVKNYIFDEMQRDGEDIVRQKFILDIQAKRQKHPDIKERSKERGWEFFETTELESPKTHLEVVQEFLLKN